MPLYFGYFLILACLLLADIVVRVMTRRRDVPPAAAPDYAEILLAINTVKDSLHGTLDKRLNESFRTVAERLDSVHRGLGEMQSLASDVTDLRRVLSNVKTRGTWGEVQLGALLEQLMHPGQYAKNVTTKATGNERVEFVLKIPSKDDETEVLLPIDSKFPQEDYLRLTEAAPAGYDAAVRAFETQIRLHAKDIATKYINPPVTTDFAVMFVPSEGIFAEVVRRPALLERLQRDHRVVVMGPTTLGALLNSLQIGFSSVAIQKRSGEVWTALTSIRTEFAKFGEFVTRLSKKGGELTALAEEGETRYRMMDRTLKQLDK